MTINNITEPQLQQLVESWQQEGFSVEHWTSPPGEAWSDAGHATDEILVILEGCLDVTIDGVLHRSEVGKPIRIPARVPHSTLNPLSKPCRMLWAYGYKWKSPQSEGTAN